jgi:putative NDP-sugar dehydratase or epimerase|nr:NAD(P)-dependent oxidoreductase [uncultured Selenomonas sp.]
MKKKIILFGATGNVGSYMAKYLSEYFLCSDYEVIASGRRRVANVFQSMGIEYISVDITKPEEFANLPTENVYAVILLAAVIPAYMKEYSAEQYLQTNIMGTYHVLEYCRKVHADRILFSTSIFDISLHNPGEYGLTDDLPLNFSYHGDHSVYIISKNSGRELLKHYHAEYGLKYFVFRFPSIYLYSPEPYYYPNGKQTVHPLHLFVESAKAGKTIELWGDPNYASDMVYVYDCSQMFARAITSDRDGGLYNVGTGHPITLQEKINTIIEVFSPQDHPSKIVYCPEKKNSGAFCMNVDKAKRELGYAPVYDVRKLFEDYKNEMELNRFAELRAQ